MNKTSAKGNNPIIKQIVANTKLRLNSHISRDFYERKNIIYGNYLQNMRRLSEKKHGPFTDDQWEELLQESDEKCRQYEKEGRNAYNIAILTMIAGLFLAIASYNLTVAFLVAIIGYALEALQFVK